MKKIFLLLSMSLLMAGSALAECLLYIDDFTVTPDQIGTEIELCIKAEFSGRLNGWQLDLTYPEGLTPVSAELGADGPVTYINARGYTAICTPYYGNNADYTRFVASIIEFGYMYDPNAGGYITYGTVKWEAGIYDEMIRLRVEVSEDFQGGEIIMSTMCSSEEDSRGGTIRENGDHGVTFTCSCNVSVEASGSAEAYACYTPENTTLTFYYDGQRDSRPGTSYGMNNYHNAPGWYVDGISPSVTSVVFDPSFADARPISNCVWFADMSNLQSITGIEYLNTDSVTDMDQMFRGCESLTSLDVSGFSTSNVRDMNGMFNGCYLLTSLDVSGFNTSKVQDMNGMFSGCEELTFLDVSGFNTANVTDMSYMFETCISLTSLDVSGFITSNVENMNYLFGGCEKLTSLDVSHFNTSNVRDMHGMLSGCSSVTSLDVSGFNTSNVQSMESMFADCKSLTSLDVSGFITSKVQSMGYMFSDCESLTSLDVSGFNTSKVQRMEYMFSDCKSLTSLDLSGFNTNMVTRMHGMFGGCENLTTIYVGEDWSTANVTLSNNMFNGCMSLVGGMGTTYSDSNPKDKTYAHLDGGPSNPGYFTEKPEAYACYTPENTTLTFYYDTQRSTRTGVTYDLNTDSNYPGWYSDGTYYSVTQAVFDPSFADARPTSTFGWFSKMSNLPSITDMKYLNTSNVTNMGSMFSASGGLTSLDVSNFNTANVTNMAYMFYSCWRLTSLDLRSFNTANVTNMLGMFQYSTGLTSLDLSSFNTANVTDMSNMFAECMGLPSLDLSSFNTSNVTNMYKMFDNCWDLTTICVGEDWSTANVTLSNNMFNGSTSLVGGMGTTYSDSNPKDKTYAHIDGGPSNPGYFSEKPVYLRGDVNGDGEVSIADVTALIDYLLGGDVSQINLTGADTDQNNEVSIADVTALIDYLLVGSW